MFCSRFIYTSKRIAVGFYLSKDVADDAAAPSTGVTRAILFTGEPLFRSVDEKLCD